MSADLYAGPLVVVSSYSKFSNLAHGPNGTEASHSLRVYRLNPHAGTLSLQTVLGDKLENPAFSRFLPERSVVYTCTETVEENGKVFAFKLDHDTGAMTQIGAPVDAGGSSTCYLTIDPTQKWMLVCNYWNSLLCTMPMDPKTGSLLPPLHSYDPKKGNAMKVSAHERKNHSINDASVQANRQADPHSHALVIAPYTVESNKNRWMAYVPDLGMDIIRQFSFDANTGILTPAGEISSGPQGLGPHGPRYIAFQTNQSNQPAAFVVNELSSTVSIFGFSPIAASHLHSQASDSESEENLRLNSSPTLILLQTISTIPPAFSRSLNTCGRICMHPNGNYVLVSNRGHDSIAIFRVSGSADFGPKLIAVGVFHTLGRTPRHFQLDASGQWLIAANQDSDSLSVFRFNMSTGALDAIPTSHVAVPSPNFVMFADEQTKFNPWRLRLSYGNSPTGNTEDMANDSIISEWEPKTPVYQVMSNSKL
eukprot:g749.t1